MGCTQTHQPVNVDLPDLGHESTSRLSSLQALQANARGIVSYSGMSVYSRGNEFKLQSEVVCASLFGVSEDVLVIATVDGQVHIFKFGVSQRWEVSDSLRSLNKMGSIIQSFATNPGIPSLLYSSDTGGYLSIWRFDERGRFSGSLGTIKICKKSLSCIASLQIRRDKVLVFCGGADPCLWVVQIRLKNELVVSVRPLGAFPAHASAVTAVETTSYLGGLVVTASDDRTIRIWALSDILGANAGIIPHATHIMSESVLCMKFSSNSRLLAGLAGSEILVLKIDSDPASRFVSEPVVSQKLNLTAGAAFTSCYWGPEDACVYATFDNSKYIILPVPKSTF